MTGDGGRVECGSVRRPFFGGVKIIQGWFVKRQKIKCLIIFLAQNVKIIGFDQNTTI